jgi:hypothetical protein
VSSPWIAGLGLSFRAGSLCERIDHAAGGNRPPPRQPASPDHRRQAAARTHPGCHPIPWRAGPGCRVAVTGGARPCGPPEAPGLRRGFSKGTCAGPSKVDSLGGASQAGLPDRRAGVPTLPRPHARDSGRDAKVDDRGHPETPWCGQ